MLPSTETITMSSREIADLLSVRHDAVKRTIGRLATDKVSGDGVITKPAVITLPPLVETSFIDAAGKTQWTTEYRVGKRDSYVIVAQLSPEFTARLVDRWQELEQQIAKPKKTIASDSPLEFALLILETMPNLSESAKQVMLSKASEIAFGVPLLPLPKVDEHLMSATEVGKLLGVSAQAIGRMANANGLKTDAHGEVRLDKSRHSSKMVENFFYNQAGVEALRAAFAVEA